jgi:pimeloyl-ACP methyl ester carboxylesterase
MTTFVLIPGAGTDPRVFAGTITALVELGHAGLAPPLPLDEPDATPSDHAAAVLAALPADLDPSELVVVGHSLGAFAAPIVAANAGAAGLVLVAPMIPVPGESAGEWGDDVGHEAAIAKLRERIGPPEEWNAEGVDHAFFHDVPTEVKQANAKYDGADVPGMFGEPWPLAAWPEVPTRVLIPREDRLFPLEFQRRVARERLGIEVDEIDGGHLPYLSRPAELAQRLTDLAPA